MLDHPEALGFPGAFGIRNVRVAPHCGRIDVMLLPVAGPRRLVLVEVKHSDAADAASKVIGQLLMYYAGGLQIGARGLELLRRFATNRDAARRHGTKSPKQLSGGLSPPSKAWDLLQSGERLEPGEIALYIALTGLPRPALRDAVAALRDHHGLTIGLVIVQDGIPCAV